ncbi:hypothetical protein B0H13DRAFT_1587148, partial [Mycena leptocephala]
MRLSHLSPKTVPISTFLPRPGGERALTNQLLETCSIIMETPALKLPYELTAKIFSYCLPARRVRPDLTKAPLQVAQICGHWRAIALATPELWSSVLLEFWGNNYSGDDICDFFNLWLIRAADYPLSITI